MNKFESKYFNTAKRMNDALLLLLDKKDFAYITVKDICKEANVNRSTFYLHYENTTDVLKEIVDELNKSFVSYYPNMTGQELIKEEKLFLITDEYLLPYLDFIYQNRKVYKAMKQNEELFNVSRSYKKMYESIFLPILQKYGAGKDTCELIMEFYIHGVSAIILSWCNNNCDLPKEEVAHLIEGLIPFGETKCKS